MLLCALAACSARHALPPAIPAPPPHVDPEVAAPEPPDPPGRVVVTDTEVHVLEPVRFAPNSAELTPGVQETLVHVAQTLVDDPGILLVEIRGHADRAETDPTTLAQQRADATKAFLVAHQVAPARLMTYDAADSEMHGPIGDIENRRIEVLILDRQED